VALSVVPEGAPCFLLGGPAGAALRLAALRALLATVLSPRTCRPPNYVPVLELLSACRAEGACTPLPPPPAAAAAFLFLHDVRNACAR